MRIIFSKILLDGSKYVLLLDCCGFNGPSYMLAGDINTIMIMGSTNLCNFVGGIKHNILVVVFFSPSYKTFKYLRPRNSNLQYF